MAQPPPFPRRPRPGSAATAAKVTAAAKAERPPLVCPRKTYCPLPQTEGTPSASSATADGLYVPPRVVVFRASCLAPMQETGGTVCQFGQQRHPRSESRGRSFAPRTRVPILSRGDIAIRRKYRPGACAMRECRKAWGWRTREQQGDSAACEHWVARRCCWSPSIGKHHDSPPWQYIRWSTPSWARISRL
jgi:hypothetical protein